MNIPRNTQTYRIRLEGEDSYDFPTAKLHTPIFWCALGTILQKSPLEKHVCLGSKCPWTMLYTVTWPEVCFDCPYALCAQCMTGTPDGT